MENRFQCRTPDCNGQYFKAFEDGIYCYKCRTITSTSDVAVYDNMTSDYYQGTNESRVKNLRTSLETPSQRATVQKCHIHGCHGEQIITGCEETWVCTICGKIMCVPCNAFHERVSCEIYKHSLKQMRKLQENSKGLSGVVNETESETLREVLCRNEECGAISFANSCSRLVPCRVCSVVTCVRCNEAHEGRPCTRKNGENLFNPLQGKKQQSSSMFDITDTEYPSNKHYMANGVAEASFKKFGTLPCPICGLFHVNKACPKQRLPVFKIPVQEIVTEKQLSKRKFQQMLCPFCNAVTTGRKVENFHLKCKDCKIKFCPHCRHKHKSQSCEAFLSLLHENPEKNPYPGEPECRKIICFTCKWPNFVPMGNIETKCFNCQRMFCKLCLGVHADRVCVRQKYFQRTQFRVVYCKSCKTTNFVPSAVFYWRCCKCCKKACIKEHPDHNEKQCANCQTPFYRKR